MLRNLLALQASIKTGAGSSSLLRTNSASFHDTFFAVSAGKRRTTMATSASIRAFHERTRQDRQNYKAAGARSMHSDDLEKQRRLAEGQFGRDRGSKFDWRDSY